MTRPTIPQLLLVAAAATACAVLLLLSTPRWRALQEDAPRAPEPPALKTGRDAPSLPAVATATPTTQPEPVQLRLVASRGDCWLVIRSGTAQGPILFAGILERGAAVRASGRRLWVSLGAAANLDATLNGRELRSFPTGTIDVFVTEDCVSQSPSAGGPVTEETPS